MKRNGIRIITLVILLLTFHTFNFWIIETNKATGKANFIPSPPLPIKELRQMPEGHEGVYLEIDKKKNTLKVYLNETIVKSFRVATGKNEALTPEGHFQIITKVKNPWYLPRKIAGGDKKNPLGTRWMGLSVPRTGGYKYGIHGTNNPYSIGRHVSQGCIRMHNKDIEWLYRHIPLKTPVIIISSLR